MPLAKSGAVSHSAIDAAALGQPAAGPAPPTAGDERRRVGYTGHMEQRRPGWRLAGTVSIVGLLAVSALQLHSVEARLATQSQQLRVLGEVTERMAAKLERVQGGVVASGMADAAAPSLANVRHPELPDFLHPKEPHCPP